MTHTPGPWRVEQWRDDEVVICHLSGTPVAKVTTGLNGQTEANARLIAAAPALLEALEAYLNWNEGDPGLTAIDDKARAAIALAKGET